MARDDTTSARRRDRVGPRRRSGRARHVVDTLGFDNCIDRHAHTWREDLAAATPNGIDLDFENVGGEVMDAVLLRLNVGARVVLCGMIAAYSQFGSAQSASTTSSSSPRASLHGFLVLDHLDRVPEAGAHLGELIAAGKLH
jgi:NADPH-dependent curcumin reductase CurA